MKFSTTLAILTASTAFAAPVPSQSGSYPENNIGSFGENINHAPVQAPCFHTYALATQLKSCDGPITVNPQSIANKRDLESEDFQKRAVAEELTQQPDNTDHVGTTGSFGSKVLCDISNIVLSSPLKYCDGPIVANRPSIANKRDFESEDFQKRAVASAGSAAKPVGGSSKLTTTANSVGILSGVTSLIDSAKKWATGDNQENTAAQTPQN
ncbi:unnamed protein product [Ambrosiozyma monospora]|uniref:Unnamed protein product n=1 Tax=Ambrosiozyma monospora TaxID=43982 RepID=A0ACB5TAR5_AMBMO|nr:unnamed protein product [Ambrosiozyma monospora]